MLNTGVDRRPMTRSACICILAGLLGLTLPLAALVASSTPVEAARSQPASGAVNQPVSGPTLAPPVTARERSPIAHRQKAVAPPGAPASAAPPAHPLQLRASYSGTLTDATGRPVPGTEVALVHTPTLQRRDTRTDDAGQFAFGELAAGEYQLEMQKPGFKRVLGRIALAAGQSLRQDRVVEIGSLAEFIVVQGSSSLSRGGPPVPQFLPAPSQAPEADPCAGSAVGGCLTPPRKLVDARPVYPRVHADSGVTGKVEIDGLVGTDGFVRDLRPAEGADVDFAAAAMEAVRQWQYSPVRLNGVPQECRITVTVQFTWGRNS